MVKPVAKSLPLKRTTHRTMKTQELENDTVKQTVRERYGQIAEQGERLPGVSYPSERVIV